MIALHKIDNRAFHIFMFQKHTIQIQFFHSIKQPNLANRAIHKSREQNKIKNFSNQTFDDYSGTFRCFSMEKVKVFIGKKTLFRVILKVFSYSSKN